MPRATSPQIRKTVSLPRDLVEEMRTRTSNVSAFIAEACREKLSADARAEREAAMIERCRVRYEEELLLIDDFAAADREVWPDKHGRVYPSEVLIEPPEAGLKKASRVVCTQLRVLDKRRLCGPDWRIFAVGAPFRRRR